MLPNVGVQLQGHQDERGDAARSPQLPCPLQRSLGRRRIGRCWPVRTKQQFLDAIGVQEIVKRQMPEHDKDGIRPILAVLGGSRPFRRAERLQPSNQTLAVADETVQARVEIQLQEQIIGVLITG